MHCHRIGLAKGRRRISFIAQLVLFCCYFSTVHGADYGSPKAGYVIVYDCMGPECKENCHKRRDAVHFEWCSPNPGHFGQSALYHCEEGFLFNNAVAEVYYNDECEGEPAEIYDSYGCYQPGITHEHVQMHAADDWPSYRFECSVEKPHWSAETEKGTNNNFGVDITVVLLLIVSVCFIGCFVGYLMYRYRKRKQTAEKMLLYNTIAGN